MILISGGFGLGGSNFVLDWLAQSDEPIVHLDKLTYAGNLENLASLQGGPRHPFVQGDPRHPFVQGDLGDRILVDGLLAQFRPRAVLQFAAESHVDRSIHGPEDFIQTNTVGGWNEKPNIEIVHTVCKLLDELRPRVDGQPYAQQITYVTDRPGVTVR